MKKILLLFLCVASGAFADGFFFILYDMGESVNLVPVIERLVEEGEKVEVLLLGTAKERFQLPKEILYGEGLALADRFALADEKYIQGLENHIQSTTVVTGVACMFAKQVHDAFRGREDVRVISYWDNIQASGVSDYFKVASDVAKASHELLVPSEKTKEALPQAKVVGYPSLAPEKKVVTYIGSFDGEESYRKAWTWFSQLWAEYARSDIDLLFIPHPKSGGGKWEEEEFAKVGLKLNIMPSSQTMELIKKSHLVLCERTSTAEKAALLGCPVIHILPPDDAYTTTLIEAGLTKRATTLKELQKAFREIYEESYAGRAFQALGIPVDGLDRTIEALR